MTIFTHRTGLTPLSPIAANWAPRWCYLLSGNAFIVINWTTQIPLLDHNLINMVVQIPCDIIEAPTRSVQVIEQSYIQYNRITIGPEHKKFFIEYRQGINANEKTTMQHGYGMWSKCKTL